MPGVARDEQPDGVRRVAVDGAAVLVATRGADLHPLDATLATLLAAGRERLWSAAAQALLRPPLTVPATTLAPVDEQEVWACGVTYRRSAVARVGESAVGDVYEMVYAAERPELFLKATPRRVPRPGAALRIRADSGWDVPEPELALALDARGAIAGYLVADDVSSRSIEGANPLYLPQAKLYDDALGLSGTIVLAGDATRDAAIRSAAISVEIRRGGEAIFAGDTSVAEMQRGFEDLIACLYAELSHPAGAVLLTGTGIVPPDALTLRGGDVVRITIAGVGVLEHSIYEGD